MARIEAKYLAKKSLFDPPVGWLLRRRAVIRLTGPKACTSPTKWWNTSTPVPTLPITITPEGTRKKVEAWKTGFWRELTKKADVPLVSTSFDYKRKEVTLSEPFRLGEDMDKDIVTLMDYFKPFKGKNDH